MIQSVFAGAAGDVVLNPASSTQNVIVSGSNDPALTLKALNGAGVALSIFNKSVDSFPSWQFNAGAIRLGGGSGSPDTAISRSAAGLIAATGGLALSGMPGTVAPLTATGAQPPSASSNGSASGSAAITTGKGGNTTGATGQVAGAGGSITLTAGNGGDAPAGSTNGAGGSIALIMGAPGSGAGTAAGAGTLGIRAASGSTGIELGRISGTPGPQSPYIDWHFNDATLTTVQDYNVRIQNTGDGILGVFAQGAGQVYLDKGRLNLQPNLATVTTLRPLAISPLIDNTMNGGAPHDSWSSIEIKASYNRTAITAGESHWRPTYLGINTKLHYGASAPDVQGLAAGGTAHTMTKTIQVLNASGANNQAAPMNGRDELGADVLFANYQNAPYGTAPNNFAPNFWTTDWNVHGPIAGPQQYFTGVNMFMNRYSSTAPQVSFAFAAVTGKGTGGGAGPEQEAAAQTYPMDVGFWVVGSSGTALPGGSNGWNVGFKVGGLSSSGSGLAPWVMTATSRIGKGMEIQDFTDRAIHILNKHSSAPNAYSVVVDAGGGQAVFNDGISVPSITGSGQPSNTLYPDMRNGLIVVNTAGQMWFRANGTWHLVTAT